MSTAGPKRKTLTSCPRERAAEPKRKAFQTVSVSVVLMISRYFNALLLLPGVMALARFENPCRPPRPRVRPPWPPAGPEARRPDGAGNQLLITWVSSPREPPFGP